MTWRIEWEVDQDGKEVAAVRKIYSSQKLDAVLCITLDPIHNFPAVYRIY